MRAPTAVPLATLAEALPGWIDGDDAAEADLLLDPSDAAGRSEAIWLTAKFLFRGDNAEGMILRLDRLPATAEIVESVRCQWETPPGPEPGEAAVTDAVQIDREDPGERNSR